MTPTTEYLKLVDDMKRSRGYKGPTLERFLLENGRDYPLGKFTYRAGKAKACYANALLAVMANPDFTYVEGYISLHGVPIAHAWVVDKDGWPKDVTLANGEHILEYFGVPLKTEFLLNEVLTYSLPGVLSGQDDPRALERLLKRPPDEIVAAPAHTAA